MYPYISLMPRPSAEPIYKSSNAKPLLTVPWVLGWHSMRLTGLYIHITSANQLGRGEPTFGDSTWGWLPHHENEIKEVVWLQTKGRVCN